MQKMGECRVFEGFSCKLKSCMEEGGPHRETALLVRCSGLVVYCNLQYIMYYMLKYAGVIICLR